MLKQPSQSGEFESFSADVLTDIQPEIPNPFPGLRPFSVDECHLFFGREGQVDNILVKLSSHHFIAVMGHSGSGKSSLMNCGLVPVLYGGFITQTGPHWNVISSRPGSSPINNLAESIIDHLLQEGKIDNADKDVHKAIVNSVLRSGNEGLIEVSRYLQTSNNENVFFLIDQFEEIFRHRDIDQHQDAANEAQQFVNILMTAIAQTKVPVYVAITMRSDFLGSCSKFSGLTQLINQSNYLVPQMTREQKKMVIEGPVAVAGGKISQRLIKRLLTDMGNDQDQLPILQHALMRTWDYWVENREPGEPIDLRHYNAIGKITQALSQHANEAYDELPTRHKEIAEILFKTITEKNQENKGLRRPARLELIALLAEADEQDVMAVVDHFRKPGRSFLMPAAHVPLNNDSLIELSHESLMRIWNRLGGWVEEEFDSAQTYKRLSEAAAMYQIGKTGLWRPPDLQLALNWQKKQRPTREWAQRYDEAFERAIVFLDTSRITYEAELKNQEMLQRRLLRRTRATAIIFGVLFVIAILFFVFAFIKKLEADEQSRIAEARRIEADKQSRIAEERRVEADNERQKVEAQRQLLEESNVILERTLNELQIEKDRAEAALVKAQTEERRAVLASANEREAREIAEEKTVEAEENFREAQRLFMLTKAQELATKSVQEDDDKALAGLLAMQGYHYHRRYEGRKYDPYIYRGLYYSLTKISGTMYNAIKVQGPPRNKMTSLAVSGKGNSFYVAGADGRIFKGDYETLLNQPTGFSNPYPNKVIALSPDENYIVNGTDSAFVQVYNLQTPKDRALVIKGLNGATNDIKFMPDNSGFVVASGDITYKNYALTFINHKTGESKKLLDLPFEIKTISISPDGKKLAGGTWSGKLIIVDLSNSTYTTLVDDAAFRINTVKFSPDGANLAYGSYDNANKRGLVKLFNFKTGETRQFTGHRAGVYDVEFSPDGQLLASAGADKRLQLWVLENPEDLPVVMDNNDGFVWDITFAKGSDYLIAACSESEIRIWPTDPAILATQICPKLSRNMSADEWSKYVGGDIDYEFTCPRAEIKDF